MVGDDDEDDPDKHALELQRWREKRREMREKQEEDVVFPDEVDTPENIPARERFARYRGLKSFRSSPWDPKESLPLDYAKIFQIEDIAYTQKRLLEQNEKIQSLKRSMDMRARKSNDAFKVSESEGMVLDLEAGRAEAERNVSEAKARARKARKRTPGEEAASGGGGGGS